MKLGAVTYNLLSDFDLDTVIEKLETAGFEGVELRTTHKHGVEPSISSEERKQVRAKFEKSRVKLAALGSVCEFHSPIPEERHKQVETAKAFIDLAQDIGAAGVKVRPNRLPEDVSPEQTITNIAECLREIGYYAAERNVRIWLEVHGRDTQKPPVIEQIMKQANHPSVGVCWNSTPPDIVDGSLKTYFNLLKPWIEHVHIHDLIEDYPYRELFGLLKQMNYQGFTMVEGPASCELDRFLKYYKALWQELAEI